MTVLIAGGGIAGLAMALTCYELGLPFRVFEAARAISPLGVGINLQPTAVRELHAMGLGAALDGIGVKTQEFALYSQRGLPVWREPRGLAAGYRWPQFSIHRGKLQMLLFETLVQRAGGDCIETGWRATGFENSGDGARLHLQNADGAKRTVDGAIIIGADGIHSAIRAQMVPEEGDPKWNGTLLWRGTAVANPFLTGASMVLIGPARQRIVAYPISNPDQKTGKAVINIIAELKTEPGGGVQRADYGKQAPLERFMPYFQDYVFDWIDVPALARSAEAFFEYPMVDRDPIERWTHDRVTLMGDAAHAAYPTGSNGAGSAILDARMIGAAFRQYGVNGDALEAYEARMRPRWSAVTLLNRGKGPDSILDIVDARCGGQFELIEDVLPADEMAAHLENYKRAAGYSVTEANAVDSIL